MTSKSTRFVKLEADSSWTHRTADRTVVRFADGDLIAVEFPDGHEARMRVCLPSAVEHSLHELRILIPLTELAVLVDTSAVGTDTRPCCGACFGQGKILDAGVGYDPCWNPNCDQGMLK